METSPYQTKIVELKALLERRNQASTDREEKSKAASITLQQTESRLFAVKKELGELHARFHFYNAATGRSYDRLADPDGIRPKYSAAEKRQKAIEGELEAAKTEVVEYHFPLGGTPHEIQTKIWEQHYLETRETLSPVLREELLRSFALFRLSYGVRDFGTFIDNFFGVHFIETRHAFTDEASMVADEIRRGEAV